MRIATVQTHDGPTLVVDVDDDYRRLGVLRNADTAV